MSNDEYVTYIGNKYKVIKADTNCLLKKCNSNDPEIEVNKSILLTDDSYKDSLIIHNDDLAYNIYNEKIGVVRLETSGEYTLCDVDSLESIYHGYTTDDLRRVNTKPKFAQGEHVAWCGITGFKVKESNGYATKVISGEDGIWVKNKNLSSEDEVLKKDSGKLYFKSKEEVNHPERYNRYKREVIDVMKDFSTHEEFMGFLKNTIIKYLARYQDKGGAQDLKKADWYLQRMIKEQEEQEK